MYKVETGIQDNDYIEIKSGIDVGMRVVISPYTAISKKLKDGKDVQEKEDDDE